MIEFYLSFIIAALFMLVAAIYSHDHSILGMLWSLVAIAWMINAIIIRWNN